MKFKKLVSVIGALSIAATTFAATVVPASAEGAYVPKLTQNCDDPTIFVAADGNSKLSATKSSRDGDNFIRFACSQSNGTGSYTYDFADYTKDASGNALYEKYKITYDMEYNPQSGGRISYFDLIDASGNSLLTLCLGQPNKQGNNGPGYQLFGADVNKLTNTTFPINTWLTLTAEIDTISKKMNVSLKNDTITVFNLSDQTIPDTYGVVTGIKWRLGYSVVNADIDNIIVSGYEENVTETVGSIEVSGAKAVYNNVDTSAYTAEVSSNILKPMPEEKVTWSLGTPTVTEGYNSEGLAIDNTGILKVPETFAGTVDVIATSVTKPDVSGSLTVTVNPKPVLTSIDVSGNDSIEYAADKKIQLMAAPKDQYNQPFEADVTWSGNNDEVATIDAATGIATLTGVGEVTFTATSGSVTGSKTVNVLEAQERDKEAVILSEDYSAYTTDEVKLVEQTDAVGTMHTSLVNGISYNQDLRNNGTNTTYFGAQDGKGYAFLGDPASNGRVPRLTFDNAPNLDKITSTTNKAEVLEFDLKMDANEMVRVYDGTSVAGKSYETIVTNTIVSLKKTDDGILFNDAATGLDGSNYVHVKVVLDENAAYAEITDSVTGITYAGSGTKTDKIGGIVFGNNSKNAGRMYIDNIELYALGAFPATATKTLVKDGENDVFVGKDGTQATAILTDVALNGSAIQSVTWNYTTDVTPEGETTPRTVSKTAEGTDVEESASGNGHLYYGIILDWSTLSSTKAVPVGFTADSVKVEVK